MKNLIAILILSYLFLESTAGNDIQKTKDKTEKLFNKELKKENVHNAFLAVYSPTKNIDWSFAGGEFKTGEAVTASNPFYTASIGKTFTATSISILVEQGKLKFSDKISNYLSEDIMNGLHVFEGTDYSHDITIAHLLQHTSGLPDYYEGNTIDGSPNMMELLVTDTSRLWEIKELIDFSKEKMKSIFPPGQGYSYTDTEYILLGLIIENVSDMPLHDFFKKYFFVPNKMSHTYMNLRSTPLQPTEKMAELYVDEFELGTATSLSLDWAGGGIVSTAGDLIKFQYALNTGNIISKSTLQLMQDFVPESRGMYYGFGLRKFVFKELFPTLPDMEIIGHSGSSGSFMYYCPQLDVYLAGTLNQTEEVKESVVLLVKILAQINKI